MYLLCVDNKFSGHEKSINTITKVPLVDAGAIEVGAGAGIVQEQVPEYKDYLGR